MRSLLLLLIAASGCAPTPPLGVAPTTPRAPAPTARAAAPALPAGWTTDAPLSAPEAPPRPGSARALFEKMARARVERTRVPVAELPVVDLEPIPAEAPANGAVPAGEPAADLFVAPKCSRASVRGHRYGKIRLDWAEMPIGPQSDGGVDPWHVRPDIKQWKPASWQTLEAGESGTVTFEHSWAWFDIQVCKAIAFKRIQVTPRPLAGGLAYAFRSRCQACAAGKQEMLHVLAPDAREGISHIELAIDAGTTASMVLELGPSAIERFKTSGARPSRTTPSVIGVDVQRGVSDPEPVVTEFVADLPAR